MKAEVITIGDEILYGQITDTNTQYISSQLDAIGIKTLRKSSVGDSEEEILNILSESENRADLVIMTGGLGPTKDDITKHCLCKYFDSRLVENKETLDQLTEYFSRRGKEINSLNRTQALVPEKCKVLINKAGTAPGMWFERNNKIFISLPGVPFEMQKFMIEQVIPELTSRNKEHIIHKVIRTCGIPESDLAIKIENWENNLPDGCGLAYLPSLEGVKLRLTMKGKNEVSITEVINKEIEKLKLLIPEFIYGYDGDTLELVIGNLLKQRNEKVSFAESCTGGLLAHKITLNAGSSDYFKGGVVAYDNDVKIKQLGVEPETIQNHGAVSELSVKQMAEGVRKALNTEWGLATSGIAGPGGATADKPVGTIWIACSSSQGTITKLLTLGNNREVNIKLTATFALNLLRQRILEKSR